MNLTLQYALVLLAVALALGYLVRRFRRGARRRNARNQIVQLTINKSRMR